MNIEQLFSFIEEEWTGVTDANITTLPDFVGEVYKTLPREGMLLPVVEGTFLPPICSGVGDDRICTSHNLLHPLAEWYALKNLHNLDLSEPDMALHAKVFNFASETRVLPASRQSAGRDSLAPRKRDKVSTSIEPLVLKSSNLARKGGTGLKTDDPRLYDRASYFREASKSTPDVLKKARDMQCALAPAMLPTGHGARAVLHPSEGGGGFPPPYGVVKTLYNLSKDSGRQTPALMVEAIQAHEENALGEYPFHEKVYMEGLNICIGKGFILEEEDLDDFLVRTKNLDEEQMTCLSIAYERGELIDATQLAALQMAKIEIDNFTSDVPFSRKKPKEEMMVEVEVPKPELPDSPFRWLNWKTVMFNYEMIGKYSMRRFPLCILAKAELYLSGTLLGKIMPTQSLFHGLEGLEENFVTSKRNRLREAIYNDFYSQSSDRIVPFDLKPLCHLKRTQVKENNIVVSGDTTLLAKVVGLGGIGILSSAIIFIDSTKRPQGERSDVFLWKPNGRTRYLAESELKAIGADPDLPTRLWYDYQNLLKSIPFMESYDFETEEDTFVHLRGFTDNVGRVWDFSELSKPWDCMRLGKTKLHRKTHCEFSAASMYRYAQVDPEGESPSDLFSRLEFD